MICGMKVEKTIAAENRWDHLITEISAEKKKTITKAKTVKQTFKKLKSKKKYYFRIRTYKKVKGKKYYSLG